MSSRLLASSALLFIVLALTAFNLREPKNTDPCSNVSVVIKTDPNSNRTVAEVTGAKLPIRYFFSNAKSELVNTDFSKSEVRDLKPGKYTCLIREAGGCRKLTEFEIK